MTDESGSGSPLSIDFTDYADCRVVTITGRVDHTNSGAFLDALTGHAGESQQGMVVDVAGLEFITSAGLRALLVSHRTISARGGRMNVAGVTGSVREVFRISKFDALLTLSENVAEGVARVSDAARDAYSG